MKTMKRYLWSVVLLAGLAVGARAQQSDALTLADAIGIGLEYNYGIRVGVLQTQTAEINNTWGAAGLYPSVAVGASANWSRTYPQGDGRDDFSTTVVQPSADVSWVLFGGFRVWRTKSKLDLTQQQAEGSQTVLVENTLRSIIAAYYQAVLEEEKVSISRELMDASYDRYQREERASELGVVRNLELFQSKNVWLQDRADFLSQQNRSEEARRQLGYLLAGKDGWTWRLADTIPMIEEHFDLAELHRIAQEDNTSIRNQYVAIRLREEETRLARSDYYPSLSVGAGASYGYNRASGISTRQIQPYISAKLSFTLFNGSVRRRAVRIAEINRQAEELSLDDMRLTVNYDVDRQHSAYLLCRELVDLREEQLATSRLSLRIAEQQFRDGTLSQFDFRDVQIAYYNAAVNLLSARYDLVMAHVDLLQTLGLLLREVPGSGGVAPKP